jgi:hypothetical protein
MSARYSTVLMFGKRLGRGAGCGEALSFPSRCNRVRTVEDRAPAMSARAVAA